MQEFIELLDKSEGCLVNIGDACTTIELGGKKYSCENIEDSIDGLEKYRNKKVKAFIWKNTAVKLSNIELWLEKIADIIIEIIEIGILKINEAFIDASTPIVQWVLPRINPPRNNKLIYSEDIRIVYFCQNNRINVF